MAKFPDAGPVKDQFLELYAKGYSVPDALAAVGRTRQTYKLWRKNDGAFAAKVDRIRSEPTARTEDVPDFPAFSQDFLGMRVFPHMLNVQDLIEGREPRWTHPSMVYERGEPDLCIVNMPPEHGKSATLTVNYVVWRINKDPGIRVIVVSKTQAMASKFLYAIKTRLTHRTYTDMHQAFGPRGGWDKDSESWSQTRIYVNQGEETSGEKDPTVEALGIRGHIYGARADLIILDDCVDLTNAHEYEKQIEWIQSEVMSRISASGALLVVGTRLASTDLYSELRNPKRYPDEESPWTYFAMPALLEAADEPEDWETLWPRSDRPEHGARGDMAVQDEDGLYPKWDGKRLFKKRKRMTPRTWSLVYQQQQVADDSVFDADAVAGVINGNRLTGLIPKGMVNCRDNGMEGLIVVAGLDPAMAGHTAAVVIGLDVTTQKRYILDVHNKAGMTPDGIRELIKDWTTKYGIVEWRIEKNAFQSMLTQDREVREFLAGRGCILREHFTGSNKWDSDFGVASLTMLFYGWQDKKALVELPSTYRAEGVKALVEQLISWAPEVPKGHKTDCVMAFWFAELACRDRVMAMSAYNRTHAANPFLTRWDRSRQSVVNISDANNVWVVKERA